MKSKQGSREKDAGVKPKRQIINWFLVLLWSLLMGVTAVSMGIGSLYPPLENIAGPFVCPNGQIQVTSQAYTVSPVEHGYTLTYYCVDKQTGAQTELGFWPKHLIAGSIYGLLIFVLILAIWSLYSRYASSKSRKVQKVLHWIQIGFVVLLVVGITLFNLTPLFHSLAPVPTPTISALDTTATSIANIFQSLNRGKVIAFSSTDQPLASWNGIPIMPQATSGQHVNDTTYAFRVAEILGTIESFYKDSLKSQGWNLEESQYMEMEFVKDKNTVMVAISILDDPSCTTPLSPGDTPSPAEDLGCYIVTLVKVP